MNNFNLLRLVFALFVVISHSYPLSGVTTGDALARITNGQVAFSYVGLYGFFVISGYLVFQSLERSETAVHYFKKRILRIFPALFVVLLLTVVLGFAVYEGSFRGYIMNRSAWTYLPRNLSLIYPQGTIDGIFTHSIFDPTINGSLWSLLYEFLFYIVLGLSFFLERPARMAMVTLILAILLIATILWERDLYFSNSLVEIKLILQYGPFFFFGSLLSLVQIETLKRPKIATILLLILLIGVTALGLFEMLKFFILPPLVILLGLRSLPSVNKAIDRLGDISYGVYIYAFPVQQALMHFFNLGTPELMIGSMIISCLLGFCSWHGVEKWALKYK